MDKLRKRAERGELLSVKEVAQIFGVSPQHIYTMMRAGQIPGASRISSHSTRFCPGILLEWSKTKVLEGTKACGSQMI
ncbi:MAG TPA: helix-turn-helix domain-containing protein [Candidatus Angelobacter sp.]|nr:helix-turn-helix domain-containing protein [Candidatus Angelobacter sp.]